MKTILYEFLHTINGKELPENIKLLHEAMTEAGYIPAFPEPDCTAALAFALGVRYGAYKASTQHRKSKGGVQHG